MEHDHGIAWSIYGLSTIIIYTVHDLLWFIVVCCGLVSVDFPYPLTHWGRVTHMCVSNVTIIGSDNGLSPGRRQAIIWTNAGILVIRPFGTNFSEILIKIHTFSFKKIHLKMSSKWRSFCFGFNVLRYTSLAPWWNLIIDLLSVNRFKEYGQMNHTVNKRLKMLPQKSMHTKTGGICYIIRRHIYVSRMALHWDWLREKRHESIGWAVNPRVV